MGKYLWEIGSENIENLFETATMYFDTKNQVLDAVEINPSTYRDYLNGARDTLSLEKAYRMIEAVSSDPDFSLEDREKYIEVPEEEAWGSGRIELEDDFQEFLFSRQLFGPFQEKELQELCSIDRRSYHNYRKTERSIPVDVYRSIFDHYSEVYSREFDFSGDIYPSGLEDPEPVSKSAGVEEAIEFVNKHYQPRQRFDLKLNGSRERLEKMEGFEESQELLIEELENGMDMTRPRNEWMEEVFKELEEEELIRKIGRRGRLYRILV